MTPASEPTRFWKSPWGFNDNDGPPPRTELFGQCTSALEDFFGHNAVFYNLINGSPSHADSYMTGVASGNLTGALDLLDATFQPTASDWQPMVDEWLGNPNHQPPLRQVAYLIIRRYGCVKPIRA